MATAGQSASEPSPGSANDYVKNNPDFADASEIPLLGIEVNNGADNLKGGHPVSGVEVLSAIPSGPGAAAGLQGRRQGVQTALTVGILAGRYFSAGDAGHDSAPAKRDRSITRTDHRRGRTEDA